jgi:uncharacterized SAM-binding protein YcdF (DUF218 family)
VLRAARGGYHSVMRRAGRSRRLSCLALISGSIVVLAVGAILRYAGSMLVVRLPVDEPDAIISLASHEWERLPLTASLAIRLPEKVSRYNCHDCARRTEMLAVSGVDLDRVRILPLTVGGTYGEAVACRAFAVEQPIKRLLIVTSPYHTRRALSIFRSVFSRSEIQIGVAPASLHSPARPDRWWLARYDFSYVAYEWTATVYYAARYHAGFEGLPFSSQ